MAHLAQTPGLSLSREVWTYVAVNNDLENQEPTSRVSSPVRGHNSAGSDQCDTKHDTDQLAGAAIDPRNHRNLSWWSRVKSRLRRTKLQGWRFGVAASAATTTTVLLINTIFTIWASFKYDVAGGIGTAYTGDCGVVNAWSVGLHVLVNALSSALFGASNYTMQCLMAPTRDECNRAHARGDWLDVGVPSFRNLTRISWRRRLGWVLLALSSVPVHFLYNSATFKEMDNLENIQLVQAVAGILRTEDVDFTIFAGLSLYAVNASEKLRSSEGRNLLEWYNGSTTADLRALYLADQSAFDQLEPQKCVEIYSGNLVSGHSHAFAIVDATAEVGETAGYEPHWNSSFRSWTFLGISEDQSRDTPLHWPTSISNSSKSHERDSNHERWLLGGMPLEYCIAKRETSHCKLQFSTYILVVIIICNVMKLAIMVGYLWLQRSETFVTFGDALASWLDNADEHTKESCLIEMDDVRRKSQKPDSRWLHRSNQGLLQKRQGPPPILKEETRQAPGTRLWAAALGTGQLFSTLMICSVSLLVAVVFIVSGNGGDGPGSIKDAISAGRFFNGDTTSTLTMNLPTDASKGLIAAVLLINTPQIILSCCYLVCNGVLTSMHQAYEYSGYAVDRKGLRVTRPEGQQRSTYWLQLPYKYSLPSLAVTAILHWLISQSLFLVRIASFRADLKTGVLKAVQSDQSGVGASFMPALVGIILAICMLITVVGMGYRKLASNMPIAGSCSFALAAATHRSPEDEKAATLPLMWGEIPRMGTEELGHCAFTSEEVVEFIPERKYA